MSLGDVVGSVSTAIPPSFKSYMEIADLWPTITIGFQRYALEPLIMSTDKQITFYW